MLVFPLNLREICTVENLPSNKVEQSFHKKLSFKFTSNEFIKQKIGQDTQE